MLDPFNQNQKKKTTPRVVNTDNFIEALKGIGGGVVKGVTKDLVSGTAQNAFDVAFGGSAFSASGDLTPGGSIDFDQIQKEQAEQKVQVEHRRLHILRQKEEMVFSAREEQTKKDILKLQEELKKLAQEMGVVAKEVQVAALQEVVDPGQYHVGFFEHLRNLIQALRKKLHDSASWLHTANQRAQAKKGYWGMFEKQESKFSLHDERKLATQAG